MSTVTAERPTIQKLADCVGDIVLVPFGQVSFKCLVIDVRLNFGNKQYKLMPLEGCGEVWKEAILCQVWEKAEEPAENTSTHTIEHGHR